MNILLLFVTITVANARFSSLFNYHHGIGKKIPLKLKPKPSETKEIIVSPPHGKQCKPICSCYMDGVYYDYGDKWQKKGYPCTTYQCFDGYYIPVIRGALYKGKCKNIHDTWTEGCFTYRVEPETYGAVYRLVEGGCDDGNGNCLKVGDTFTKDCNIYECQIVGTCYTVSLISKGCVHEGECQRVNSYWHDGCSVFQCVEFDGNTTNEKLHNELMYWPEGNYALLKPKTGCPVDVDEEWSEGYRWHFGRGHNYKSFEFDAYGDYKDLYFVHHFCVRQQVGDSSILPRYQTYWEPGSYCFLRKNGACPKGFKEGYVQMNDLDGAEALNKVNGTLPDGDYDIDTLLYFCCRSDGIPKNPIVLPKQRSFILFVDKSTGECQEVRGMSHKLEFFAFDDRDGSKRTLLNGSYPLTKIGDNETSIYFCHYRPMECGCTDPEGNTIKAGKTIEIDCALYTCSQLNGKMVLSVDKGMGGCLDENKKCRNESEVWMVSSGESCDQKRCVRVHDANKLMFQVKTDFQGCKDKTQCRPINYQINRGCYRSVCSAYTGRRGCHFKMQKAGCSDGKGGCVPLGKEFKKNCITYKCSTESSACGLKFLKGGCMSDGVCREIGESWGSQYCHSLHCSMSKTGRRITFTVKGVIDGCYRKGKCYKSGHRLKEGCATWECQIDSDKNTAIMDVVKGGCAWKGKCIDVNVKWKVGCDEYTCKWIKTKNHHHFMSTITEKGCAFGTSCLRHGESRTHKCSEYECFVTSHDYAGHSILKPIRRGCQLRNGNCLGINEQIEQNCVLYKCQQGLKYMQLSAVRGAGCRVNGVCKAEGSVWTDKSLCVDYKCIKKTIGNSLNMVISPVSVGCLYKGICHPHGEKWICGKCLEKKCITSTLPNNTFTRKIETVPTGCLVDGICRPFNYKKMDGCIQYTCSWDHYRKSASYSVKAGCKEYYGDKCHDVGDVWTERKGKQACYEKICRKSGNLIHTDITKQMCQDAYGNCVSINKHFERLADDGKKWNCFCGGTTRGISISCSMHG